MISNKSIFANQCFDLPIKSEEDFSQSLKNIYKEFLTIINGFTGDVHSSLISNKPIIEKQCISLIKVVDTFLNGFPGQAYFILKECMDELNSLSLLEIQRSLTATEKGNLYRVRADVRSQLKQKDVFHIPFDLREKVATQRYSIPGLPCLYLGDSIFVCWEEMDRPALSNLHVSRFDLSLSDFKLLDLNINTNDLRKRCFPGNKEKFIPHLVKFITYWPLLAACSFIVRKPTEVFKPEYIVPQLLLQWIVDAEGVDGIKYKSNRVKVGPNNVGSFTNVVIPVKQISNKGFCKILSKKIKFTNPISWSLLEATDPKQDFLEDSGEDLNLNAMRRASYIEIIEGERTIYITSKFGILEEKLKTMTSKLLT
ncbi:hypothetical protein [Mucilaginibacter sp. 3215]|uniref:hypothetical protein n=1 Tax=Mucilaginibacter sp. 3215 TaxID=3373912 RepID=UPI003D197FE3